jgi:DNA-binding PadR family transcriptional regulator
MHGHAIAAHIRRVSSDSLRIDEGSLYPDLHRMTRSGWLAAEWGASDNGRGAREPDRRTAV